MKRFRNHLPFLTFATLWLLLRVVWITCDTGVPSTWEFGFHTTDEGYYLCGGKEMYLWGSFVDLTRQEALNYCYSYGTHWLSYLAHLCFGLSTWSWRIPFVALYFTAWMMMFGYVRRRIGGWCACATCLAASCLPLVVTYERGASNDATIAALTAIAFALAAGKGRWRIAAAALVTSAIATIKPSVWVMMPLVLSALLEERKTRSRGLDAGAFIVLTSAFVYGWKGLSALTVLDVARASGLTAWEVLARVNATYGLPAITDLAQDFRAFASFPRDPAVKVMGVSVVMISALPAAMFLLCLVRRKWSSRLLLYLMVPMYAYALNVINSMYTHYFLPLLILLPALFTAIHTDFAELKTEQIRWKPLLVTLTLTAAALAACLLLIPSPDLPAKKMLPFYSKIYNLPKANPWLLTWPLIAVGTFVGVGLLTLSRGVRALAREGWVWCLTLFLVLAAAFATWPAVSLAPHMKGTTAAAFMLPLAQNLIAGALFAYLLFVRPAVFARRPFAASALVVPILVSYLLLPTWRAAAVELLTRRTHSDATAAQELARIVPSDAIVLGERTDQAFLSLPVRTVSTFLSGSNPIPYVERILKENPKAKLYALIDSQCNFNLKHFKKHEKDYRLDTVKTLKMQSFNDGAPVDVHLCRIVPLR